MANPTITRTDVWAEILRRYSPLGYQTNADSLANGPYVQDARMFKNARLGPEDRADLWLERYNRTDDDRLRTTTTLDTTNGRLSAAGANWLNTTDLAYRLLGTDPDPIHGAILLAQQDYIERSLIPLGLFPDADMETAGVTYWDGTVTGIAGDLVNVSLTKSTTDLRTGTQALRGVLSSASGYCRGQRRRVQAGRALWSAILVRADVGTVTFRIWNTTGGAYIGSSTVPNYAGEGWAVLWRRDTVPTGCEEVQYEVGGTSSADVFVVDSCFGPYLDGETLLTLQQSWMDRSWKLPLVRPATYKRSITGLSGVYDANSRVWTGDYELGIDYTQEHLRRELNGNQLDFNEAPALGPLWLATERPNRDTEPLSTEASTCHLLLDEFMPYVMHRVYEHLDGLEGGKNADIRRRFEQSVIDTNFEVVKREKQISRRSSGVNRFGGRS